MAEMFAPAPEPKTPLGRYRVLSSTAGIRVSPLQLGAMSIGDAWNGFMGSMSKVRIAELVCGDWAKLPAGSFLQAARCL